jgi:hypothetical protein
MIHIFSLSNQRLRERDLKGESGLGARLLQKHGRERYFFIFSRPLCSYEPDLSLKKGQDSWRAQPLSTFSEKIA